MIKNPYTGEIVTCRCGKCDACRNTRASNWVKRLDMEASCHKYVLFCTLTYDEQHVNQIVRLDYESFRTPTYLQPDTGEPIDLSECGETLDERDRQYIKDTKVCNVLSVRDFQLFIKRLRYYFDRTDKGALLRYFICGEYGPRTYRPHGHMLLFFDSEKCANEIQLLLCKAWTDEHGEPLGTIYDPHFVSGSASQYCASYINSLSRLPRLYLHRKVRPFHLFSKRPAIGSLYPSVKEVREIFDRGDIMFRRFDQRSNTFKDEYFWPSMSSRLYPRCQRFGSLSHADRVTLYRLVEEFPPDLTAREIARRIKSEYLDKPCDTFLGRYFREIAYKKVKSVRFVNTEANRPWFLKGLPFLPKSYYPTKTFDVVKTETKRYNENSLIRFVSVLSRVRHQSQIFGVSIPYYVSKIEAYYEKVSASRLKDYFKFQEEYFASHPAWHSIYLDYSFYKDVRKDFIIPPLDDIDDFKSFSMLHRKIAHDLVKTKENNDYALSKKDKFGNIIKYQNL